MRTFALICFLAASASSTAASSQTLDGQDDEFLISNLGIATTSVKCPRYILNHQVVDEIWRELRRRKANVNSGRLEQAYREAYTASESRVKEGDLEGYCTDMLLDYGPNGRVLPNLVVDRRKFDPKFNQ